MSNFNVPVMLPLLIILHFARKYISNTVLCSSVTPRLCCHFLKCSHDQRSQSNIANLLDLTAAGCHA